MNQRSPIVATVMSLVVPGLGHLYLGQLVAGLGLLVGHVALGALGTLSIIAGLPSLGALILVSCPWCALWLTGAAWAYCAGRAAGEQPVLREYQRPYVYVLVGLLAIPNQLAWTLVMRERVLELFVVPSGSMLPEIDPGSRIVVNKLVYQRSPVRFGDRVVFTNPNARHTRYIKRVVGLPGDVIEMRDDELFVNGRPLAYTDVEAHGGGRVRVESLGQVGYPIVLLPPDATKKIPVNFAPLTVPNGHCFLLGDNRRQSEDSRVHGPVPLSDIIGRVERVF